MGSGRGGRRWRWWWWWRRSERDRFDLGFHFTGALLTAGAIVTTETYEAMVAPRHLVEEEGKRYGLGTWLHESEDVLIAEGYDAGVSFWSAHVPATATTVTVIANTSEGAWPVAGTLLEALETSLTGASPEGDGDS